MVAVQRWFGVSSLYIQSAITRTSKESCGCVQQSWGLVLVLVSEVKNKVGCFQSSGQICLVLIEGNGWGRREKVFL